MSVRLVEQTIFVELPEPPDTSHLITEDDTPVDNLYSEKAERFLAEPLHSSEWPAKQEGRPFVVAANVGVFYSLHRPAVVPDVFLSIDAQMADDWWEKAGRSYLIWEAGKPPDVVIEIVSNTKGEELGAKMQLYGRIGVPFYAVFDPDLQIQRRELRLFRRVGGVYEETFDHWIEPVQLGLTVWEGVFEGRSARWLRWCDRDGSVIPTGQERADMERALAMSERERADLERERADLERERADLERERAERFAAQLRALGITPSD
jgi:Uma2 family endonuclease